MILWLIGMVILIELFRRSPQLDERPSVKKSLVTLLVFLLIYLIVMLIIWIFVPYAPQPSEDAITN